MSRCHPRLLLAAVLLLVCTPTNAARRIGGSPYDGTWSVYQASGVVSANGAVRVSVTGAGRSASGWGRHLAIPARDDGGRREENQLVSHATHRLLLRPA